MTCSQDLKPAKVRRLLGRSKRRLVLLAPSSTVINSLHSTRNSEDHRHLIAQMQALRGDVYLKEAFLRPEDLTAGRHRVAIDESSWHLLLLENDDRICGCIRYRECKNDVSYSQLLLANSALARCQEWGGRLQTAVQEEIAFARHFNLPYVEVGGWALAETVRGTSEALRMALATYALAQLLGHAVGTSTARQSGSGTVLRKIGGRALEHRTESLPAYYDPMYQSVIEVLRFYSWSPNPRFQGWIDDIKAELREAPVYANSPRTREWTWSPSLPNFGFGLGSPGESYVMAS